MTFWVNGNWKHFSIIFPFDRNKSFSLTTCPVKHIATGEIGNHSEEILSHNYHKTHTLHLKLFHYYNLGMSTAH